MEMMSAVGCHGIDRSILSGVGAGGLMRSVVGFPFLERHSVDFLQFCSLAKARSR